MPPFKIDFEHVTGVFSTNWLALKDHAAITERGLCDYESKTLRGMQNLFRRGIGTRMRPANVPAPLAGPLTESTADPAARAWCKNRFRDVRPIKEAADLVFAHAVFETLMIELASLAIEKAPDHYIRMKHGDQTISLRDTGAVSPEDLVRGKLVAKCRRGMSLKEVVDVIVGVCSAMNPGEATLLLASYRPNFADLESADERRQDILHRLEFDQGYAARHDIKRLERLARCFSHLYANCVEGQDLALFHRAAVMRRGPEAPKEVIIDGIVDPPACAPP